MVVQTNGGTDPVAVTLPYNDLGTEQLAVQTPLGPRLLGSVCRTCDQKMLGRRFVCSHCMGSDLEESLFGPSGTLYSYTVIRVSPRFSGPQPMGYVDLDEGVRVLALIDAELDQLECDLPVELIIGDDWHFAPTAPTREVTSHV